MGAGTKVTVYGHVETVRRKGRIAFILLRTFDGEEQVTVKRGEVSDDLWSLVEELGREYFVRVEGTLVQSSIARLGREIMPERIEVIAPSKPTPIDLYGKVEAEWPTRLRYRYLDIRRPKVKAIFRIRSTLMNAAREFLRGEGFVELSFPIIIATATEGGAELFPVDYFGRKAFLAQSSQLYKQSAVAAFGRVFSIAPSFRAEKSRTRKHLTEFWQIDVEAALVSKRDLMDLQFRLVNHIVERILEENERDLEILGVKDLEPWDGYDVVSYDEALEILRRKGFEIEWGEDFGADEERALVSEFDRPFFIPEFPAAITAFYYMVDRRDPRIAHRIDMMGPGPYGVEWSSGGLREYEPARLRARMRELGLNPESFGWYLDMFEYGFPPHGGFGMGVERLMQTLLRLERIHEAALYPRTPDIVEP
ncbi:MAG: aspartate--tRNA(Asn) ligase [Desulfurococcales archaeon]|nr:aspartate--tRNA(Asn) ligase [Desulfurococcales archaeon]